MTWTGVVRWGLRGFGALVVLVLAWVLFGRIYAVRRLDAAKEAFKQKVGPLELSAWASPSVPDEENAAIPIRSGALGLVLSDADRALIGELTRNPTDTMTEVQIAGLRRILETNRNALEAIGAGARLGRSNFGDELRLAVPRLDADGKPRLDTLPKSPLVGVMNAARICGPGRGSNASRALGSRCWRPSRRCSVSPGPSTRSQPPSASSLQTPWSGSGSAR